MKRLGVSVLRDPVHLLSTGFGLGLAPFAPGTFGTLLGVALDPVLRLLAFPLRASAVAALFLAGIWICEKSAARLGVHDHPAIVWDEVVGYLAVMLVAPAGWLWAVAGFCVFRFFDIVKPWPIRDVDHAVGGGVGIMLDDLLAAAYGALVILALKTLLAQT
jgi:phosphatidylglycerophosphatase A